MRKYYLLLLSCCFSLHLMAQNFGEFASAAHVRSCGIGTFYNMTGSGANCINTSCGTVFQGTNFGSYLQNSGALVLKGGEIKTWKNGGANVCGGNLMYTIYPTGFRPASPVFNPINLPFKANCGGATFTDGLGPCGGNDQKWSRVNDSIDLTNFSAGNYTLEIYIEYFGDDFSTSGCGMTRYISNGGFNYLATFSIVSSSPSCGLVLPSSLLSFETSCSSNFVDVHWTMETEQPYQEVMLESSTDFQSWKTEQAIPLGQGHLNAHSFRYLLDAPNHGWLYVRLVGKDENGASTVLAYRVADCSNQLRCVVVNDDLVILNIPKEATSIGILDLQGKLIEEMACTGNENIQVDIRDIASGTYFIVVNAFSRPIHTERFIQF